MKHSIIIILLLFDFFVTNAQKYYSLELCKTGYNLRMYETILPSLLHIKNSAENGGNFDAEEYFGAAELLCAIYTDHFRDPETSAKIMDKAFQTLKRKTDNSYFTRLACEKSAEIYKLIRQFSQAEARKQEAEKLFATVNDNGERFSKLHTEISSNSLFNSNINLDAECLMQQHKLQEALDLYEQVKMFNDYNNLLYFRNIVTCALFLQKYDVIKKYYNLFGKEMIENKARVFFKSTEENCQNIWYETVKDVEYYNFAAYKSQMQPVIADAFAASVFFKTLSLESNKILYHFVKTSGTLQLKSAFERCQNLKHNLIFQKKDSLSKTTEYLEYARLFDSILTHSPQLPQKLWNQMQTFSKLKTALSENEYVIEFCLIPDYEEYPVHTDYFGAYIIERNFSTPKLIKLAKTEDIEKIVGESLSDIMLCSEFYSGDKTKQIYDLIIKPLEPYLLNVRTVYYSLYGVLANINFDYLTDKNGTFLGEKYKMVRVSSVSQIIGIKSRNITASKSAALFGNIDYGTSPEEMRNAENEVTSRGKNFGHLEASKLEIEKIWQITKQRNIDTKLYENATANEKVFKLFSGHSPEILHLATHGFCFDTDEKAVGKPFAQNVNSYSQKESAMIFSGLALSGANNVWKGNFDLPDTEDGILTAYEISQLDLSNTKLVVLSACETARGRIFPVDGVFGLQRAFKQAGAGSILMSLWKVDDGVTAVFMEQFYKHLFSTSDRHKALKLAQEDVKKQFPDPYYWAAWVMLD